MCDNDNDSGESGHPGMVATSTSHRAQKSCRDTGGGGGGAAALGPVLAGEHAVAEGVALKSDRGDVDGISREVEVWQDECSSV